MLRYLYIASFLILWLLQNQALAQKQTNIWYFGHNSGLDFNSSPPQVLTNSAMRASEGVATIADGNGNLLFYTDGVSIWNKNHVVMTNGTELAGHISSRQGVVIVPQPGSKTRYFVFTSDALETKWLKGLRYSVVDMALQGGLGEVVRKNVFLQPLAEENLTATGSCNCSNSSEQYWLAADRQDWPGYLFAYLITKAGVQAQAAVSSLSGVSNITYLKFSPTGDKIAFTGLNDKDQAIIGVADFDQALGAATNLKLFPAGHKNDYHRAVEFSSNGKVLYFFGGSPGIITQYDLTQPTVDKILASALVLTEPKYEYMHGAQLASDGKIYISTATGSQMGGISVIEHPNVLGMASSFKPYAIQSRGGLMLANFVSSFLYQNDTLALNADAGPDQQVCGTAATRLGGKTSKTLTYRWSPDTFLSDPTAPNPAFRYPKEIEKDTVLQYVLTAADGSCMRRDTVQVTVHPLPKVSITGSRSVCPGVEAVIYQLTPIAGQTYQWQVNGGTIAYGQGTEAIQVNWGPTNAAAWVEVVPTSAQGCAGPAIRLPVRINVELDTETPKGPASVCINQASGNIYQVTNTNGSVYTWGLIGGTLTSGQGTAQVKVTWQEKGPHRIWLQEQSTTRDTICFGVSDTLQVNVFRDNTILSLLNVSVNSTDDQQVLVNWSSTRPLALKGPLTILRRERGGTNWQAIGTTAAAVTTFTDQGLQTDERVYEYRVESINSCDESIGSERHNTIQLRVKTAEANGKILLTWNAYEGWPQGVERYEIWRRLDQEAEPTLLGQVTGQELTFSGASSLDGFEHRFHIKAISRDGTYASWSNELELTYTHELIAPNIITPNGDGKNDTFTIPLLGLYPDNQLTVYNRLGRSVYSAVGYRNDWSAEGLADGTYYYSLLLPQTGKLLKGWIEVLK